MLACDMSKGLKISIIAFFDHNILINVFIDRFLTVFAKYHFRHIEKPQFRYAEPKPARRAARAAEILPSARFGLINGTNPL